MRARFLTAGAITLALALAFGIARGPASLVAADHLDAPGLTQPGGDSRLDINDVYAFQSPANANNAVVIVTVNPAAGLLTGQTGFSTTGRYDLEIDLDSDAKPDAGLRFTFGAANASGVQAWQMKGTAKAAHLSAAGTTSTVTNLPGGAKITAGTFDDPFFFDLVNFLAVDFSCTPGDGDTSNFFLGLNTLAIAVELPRTDLGQDSMGIWARTMLDDTQIDRMGRPAINTVFIPNNIFEPSGTEPSQRNAFNSGKPQHDQRDFRGEVVDTLDIFHTLANANVLADILLPDILTVDFSNSAGFLNGRQLANDVIDAELGIVTNGAVTTDCVPTDSAFTGTFPYLAPAN